MRKQQTISVSLDSDDIAALDRIASKLGISLEKAIATALLRFVDEESPMEESWRSCPAPPSPEGLEALDHAAAALRSFIQGGIDSVDRGELADHEEVIAELKRRRRKHAA
jgi:predicted transcriptional regulator